MITFLFKVNTRRQVLPTFMIKPNILFNLKIRIMQKEELNLRLKELQSRIDEGAELTQDELDEMELIKHQLSSEQPEEDDRDSDDSDGEDGGKALTPSDIGDRLSRLATVIVNLAQTYDVAYLNEVLTEVTNQFGMYGYVAKATIVVSSGIIHVDVTVTDTDKNTVIASLSCDNLGMTSIGVASSSGGLQVVEDNDGVSLSSEVLQFIHDNGDLYVTGTDNGSEQWKLLPSRNVELLSNSF
jgi:hypothetical protein